VTYVGIPYLDRGRDRAGLDCWGLVRLFYREELGIELPSYADAYATAEDTAAAETLFAVGRRAWTPVQTPERGDVLLFRIGRHASHVGVFLQADDFLHVLKGRAVTVERISDRLWAQNLVGAYRWTAAT
jgi:cell wall-associated NlpC family hydrolase